MSKLSQDLTPADIGAMLDVSAVQAESTWDDALYVLETADKYDASAVFLLGEMTRRAVPLIKERNARRVSEGRRPLKLGGVIGFPDGGALTEIKAAEARALIQLGCDELDCVLNVGLARSGDWEAVAQDLAAIREAALGLTLKVILEVPYLDDAQIVRASEIVANSGAQYAKTSTGWPHENKTSIAHVALMKRTVGDRCKVKAAGGIRDLEKLLALYDAGARLFGIGYKSVIQIMEQAYQRQSV